MWVYSAASAQAFMTQAILNSFVLAFSLNRAYRFDRCRSLMFWTKGRSREQRCFYSVMLWTLIVGLSSDLVEGASIAVIRYQVGSIHGRHGDVPFPPSFWTPAQRRWLIPSYFLTCCAWTSAIILHGEEALYWSRLVNLKPDSPGWFASKHFKAVVASSLFTIGFMFGSCAVLINNPRRLGTVLVTILGVATALQNCVFSFYVNRRFPRFLADLQCRGAQPSLLNRFSEFNRVNRLRVMIRWILPISTLALGLDAFTEAKVINFTPWAVDFLVISALASFALSTSLTLVIFLPLQPKFDLLSTNPSLRDLDTTAWVPPPLIQPALVPPRQIVREAASVDSRSEELFPHPFVSAITLRQRRMADDSIAGIATSLHPDVLGYASPIDISSWREHVGKVVWSPADQV